MKFLVSVYEPKAKITGLDPNAEENIGMDLLPFLALCTAWKRILGFWLHDDDAMLHSFPLKPNAAACPLIEWRQCWLVFYSNNVAVCLQRLRLFLRGATLVI